MLEVVCITVCFMMVGLSPVLLSEGFIGHNGAVVTPNQNGTSVNPHSFLKRE